MSRQSVVIRALHEKVPQIKMGVKTSVSDWFIGESVPRGTMVDACSLDVGVIQSDSLNLDIEAALTAYSSLIDRKDEIIEREVKWCRDNGVKLIVSDIVPFAFEIGDVLGIPSIGVANFSWDWIYEPYVKRYPVYEQVVADIRGSESKCTLCLTTPFSGDLRAFPHRQEIPLICRKSVHSKPEARRTAGLPSYKKIVLISFGGFGLNDIDKVEPDIDDDTIIVVTQPDIDKRGWTYFAREDMAARNIIYPDLVRAADAVITKPGYGIVSECIANGTGMIYVGREDFAEYEVLSEGMKEYLPAVEIPLPDLNAGKWSGYIRELTEDKSVRKKIGTDGGEEAAEIILSYYECDSS